MAIIGRIKYPGTTHYDNPESFLLQSEVDELVEYAKKFAFDNQIDENAIKIITNSPGLDEYSFNVDGRAPLNEVTNELLRNMLSSIEIFKIQADAIQSRGYSHIYNEAATNYLTIIEEYKKRLTKLEEEVNTYNDVDNSTYTYSEIDENGNEVTKYGLRATCTLKYNLDSSPTLTFNEGTGPGGNKEATDNYTQLMNAYNDCVDLFSTYVIDAIELKNKAKACKNENTFYSIDKRIDELLNQEKIELTGEVRRGIPTELSGRELKEFMKENKIHDLPGLKIYRETVNINSVDFNLYRVIDPNNYDKNLYEKFIDNSLKYLSLVDTKVLDFVASNNTELIYNSSYECSDIFYDKGNFKGSGIVNARTDIHTANINMFAIPDHMNDYGYGSTVHELGHAVEIAIDDKKVINGPLQLI